MEELRLLKEFGKPELVYEMMPCRSCGEDTKQDLTYFNKKTGHATVTCSKCGKGTDYEL